MDFHGAVDVRQNIVKNLVLESLTEFPQTPKAGQFVFKDNKIFLCVSIQGVLSWVPITNEISVAVFDNKSGLEWTLTHTFGTNPVLIQVYNTQGQFIIPDAIDCSTANQVTVRFAVPVTGKAIMLAGEQIGPIGTGPVSEPFANITDKPTTLSGYGITDAYTKTETAAFITDVFSNEVTIKDINLTGDIIPDVDGLRNIGTPAKRFKSIYVEEAHLSLNTLYLGTTPILGTNGNVVNIHGDPDQSIDLTTSGTGNLLMSTQTNIGITAPNISMVGNLTLTGDFNMTGNYVPLDNERARAMAAEADLASAIQSEANTRASVDNSVADQFQAEADARTAADNDLSNRIDAETLRAQQAEAIQSDWNATTGPAVILNKPVIPEAQVQADWTAASGPSVVLNKPLFSTVATTGNYADLNNKPTFSTAATTGDYNDLVNKPVIPAAQVQPDWNATTGLAEILNKPALVTTADIDSRIQAVVGAAPIALDTLAELSTALGNDANFASSIATSLAAKANTASLSAVAFSGSYNDLLDKPAASSGAQADWTASSGPSVILNKPLFASVSTTGSYNDLTDKPTISTVASTGSYLDLINTPTFSAVATTGNYSDLIGAPSIPAAQVQSDWNALSGASFILNKPTISAAAISGSYLDLTDKPALASVATTGSYNDLIDKPSAFSMPIASATTLGAVKAGTNVTIDVDGTISAPAAQIQADWAASTGLSVILNKPLFSSVATTGSYNDLLNKPTIPAAQVQPDWTAVSGMGVILHKPTTLAGYGITDAVSSSSNAASATKLQTARTLAMTGDVVWTSPSFDGTGNVTAAATLASSGVTAGTYQGGVTVDAKGRVTSASNIIGGAEISHVFESVNTISSGATPSLDANAYGVFDVTLNANATFSFAAVTSGKMFSFTLVLHQDATGGRTVAWPASVKWAGGTAPTVTTAASKTDMFAFFSSNGGTTWYGTVGGQNF